MINRVILIVLDSVGVGELPDANIFGDEGSNTVGNIYRDVEGFNLPNMEKLGLLNIDTLKQYKKNDIEVIGTYGKSTEKSMGKDTTTGHWEMSGIVLPKPFPTFPNGFSKEIIDEFEKQTGRKAIGNCVASGTEIIKRLGAEQKEKGAFIVYTSADSVFQIAADEDVIPLEELYEACRIARNILTGENAVGRVIARPFIEDNGTYTRTENRRDFSVIPFRDTMLDYLDRAGKTTYAVGKIEDIFAQKGINKRNHTTNNANGIEVTIKAIKEDFEGLLFVNLVDFDMLYGHRNNVQGYADALKYFDEKLPEIMDAMNDDDMLIITADHGCDPTTPSTDHSREYIPVLMYGKNIKENNHLETFDTYACIGKTIVDIFDLENELDGHSVKDKILK